MICASALKAQDTLKTTESFFNKKNVSLIGITGIYAVSLVHSYNMWWKDGTRKFNFFTSFGWFNEPASLGIDRIGHFYTSYFFYHTQKEVLLWGGHDKGFATWLSAGLTGGMAILIEIGDGFTEFGFDYRDLIFNLGGLGYGILQDEVPFFRNFNFKWSYFPPEGIKFPPKFTEHYDGHIYWFTANIHNLFKESVGDFWPEFIQPAIGFSVADIGKRREFIFGLDFNLLPLFNLEDENWRLIGKTSDMIRFIPAPGIKYSPSRKPEYRLLMLN